MSYSSFSILSSKPGSDPPSNMPESLDSSDSRSNPVFDITNETNKATTATEDKPPEGQSSSSNESSTSDDKPAGGLFGGSQHVSSASDDKLSRGLSGNTTTETTTDKPLGGLFGNITTDKPLGGLFGNTTTETTTDKPLGGLFGNTTTETTTDKPLGGLFGNTTTETTTDKPLGGMFGVSVNDPRTGLFGATRNAPTSYDDDKSASRSGLFDDESNVSESVNRLPDGFNARLKVSTPDEHDKMEDSLVIGLDFGTTYSGAAWATKVDFENNQVNFVTSWPGTGREEGKVPTELWYDDNNDPVWGYEIPAHAEPFRWFKLLLLRTEDLDLELRESPNIVRARNLMQKSNKSATDLVTDYLHLLWEHVMSTIVRARGDDVVESLAIHLVITVPAIWKSYARQAMQDAVKRSGILADRFVGATKLTFAIEPEVAALSTLHEQGSGVRPGNVYVICDAGGGTVDLISYQVQSLKPIVLQEAVEGTGGLCGGIFIDQVFEQMCRDRLGAKWDRLSQTGIREIMKNEWEYGIKPQYKPAQVGKEYIVSLPAEAFKDQSISSLDDTTTYPYIKNGRIHFLSSHIKKAFEGVFADIEKLISGQIRNATEKGLQGVILVGGLGGSPYLYEYLKVINSKTRIVILQSGGIKPRTAICRGAVFKGFLHEQVDAINGDNATAPIMVTSTVARASYGIMFQTGFNPRTHLAEDKIWSTREERFKATNQMKWYLKRGDLVSKIKPFRHSWFRFFGEGEFWGFLSIAIYQCHDEVPPERKTNKVWYLGTLVCNLDMSFADLPDFHSKDGTKTKRLRYEIELVPSGASVEFVLYLDGRKQTSKSAKFSVA